MNCIRRNSEVLCQFLNLVRYPRKWILNFKNQKWTPCYTLNMNISYAEEPEKSILKHELKTHHDDAELSYKSKQIKIVRNKGFNISSAKKPTHTISANERCVL